MRIDDLNRVYGSQLRTLGSRKSLLTIGERRACGIQQLGDRFIYEVDSAKK